MPDPREPIAQPADRVLNIAENVVYAVAGALLAVGAVIVLVVVGYHLVRDIGKGAEDGITAALDGLLLVFILLELLAGVRETMRQKKLIAEPFLVVGIITSIKEIVVLTLQTEGSNDSDGAFRRTMTEIGVLTGVVLLLSLASFLVRRKEREPSEEG